MTDPVADLLTRIRNGQGAASRWIDVPASKLKTRILYILKEEHYIKDFMIINNPVGKIIRVFLKYDRSGSPVIMYLERISKPGRRIYSKAGEVPRVLDGLGISILTTSMGVVSNKVAKRLNIGGEILCNVW